MDTSRPDLSLLLPRETYYQLVHTLRVGLPPPVADTPACLAHRDKAAMAEVGSLSPVNAAEAGLAADYVIARAYMNDCLRQGRAQTDFAVKQKCVAMATSLLRQSTAKRSLLLRVQEARLKRRNDHEAVDGAAWAEHSALHLMAEALLDPPTRAAAAEAGVMNEHWDDIRAARDGTSCVGRRDGDETRFTPDQLTSWDTFSYHGKRDDDETGQLDSRPLASCDTILDQSQSAPSELGSTRPSSGGEPLVQGPSGEAVPAFGGDGRVEPHVHQDRRVVGEKTPPPLAGGGISSPPPAYRDAYGVEPGNDDLGPGIMPCDRITGDGKRDGDETTPAGARPPVSCDTPSCHRSHRATDAVP